MHLFPQMMAMIKGRRNRRAEISAEELVECLDINYRYLVT
jgi:hypothetical protein